VSARHPSPIYQSTLAGVGIERIRERGSDRPWPPASGRGPRYPSAVTLMAAVVGQFETARGRRETAVLWSPAFLFSEGPLALPSEGTVETRTRR
jgi:hypothetical protein